MPRPVMPSTAMTMIPRIHHRLLRYGLSLMIGLAGTARAAIPEPDGVVYGQLYHRFDQLLVPANSGDISVIAQLNGTTVATTVLAAGSTNFLLRLSMDDGRE